MGCEECQDMWNRRFSTNFIIDYNGSTFVVPDIDNRGGLSGKVENTEIEYNRANIAIHTRVPFSIAKQVGEHQPEPLERSDFRGNAYDFIGHLLKTGAFDEYMTEH